MKYKLMTPSQELSFFQVPLALLSKDFFPDLSTDAAIVYSLLLNLTGLSIKTSASDNSFCFADEEGKIYIIYPTENIAQWLGFTKRKVQNLMRQLESIGLVKQKRIGMDNTIRIYVKDFSAPLYENSGEGFPYFNREDSIDVHYHIRVPFAMLKDPNLKDVPIKGILLYNYLLSKVGLSRQNKEMFTDEAGKLYIYCSLDEIHRTLRIGKNLAADLLKKLDDEEGCGLIHKARVRDCDKEKRFNNKHRLYIAEYVPLITDDAEDKDNPEPYDKEKAEETLELKELPKLKHQRYRNQNIEDTGIKTSELPKLKHPGCQKQNIGDTGNKTSELPKEGINILTNLNKPNLLKDSNHIKSHQETDGNDHDVDLSFKNSLSDFHTRFSAAIEAEAILPSKNILDYEDEETWEKGQAERELIKTLIEEVVRTVELRESFKIDGVNYSRQELIAELMGINASIFLEAADRIKKIGTEIKHWGLYTIAVLLHVKRTYILDQVNKIAIFEKKLKEM